MYPKNIYWIRFLWEKDFIVEGSVQRLYLFEEKIKVSKKNFRILSLNIQMLR